MKTSYWFIYIYAQNHNDYTYATEAIDIAKSNLYNTELFVVLFGPTLYSKSFLFHVKKECTIVLDFVQDNKTGILQNDITKQFVTKVQSLNVKIDAVCIWAHGSGWVLGPWKTKNLPFITTPDFVKYIVKPLQPRLLCYDACYMGSISSLYELPSSVEIVVASPAFHPYASILWTRSFANLPKFTTKKSIANYAKRVVCEWNTFTNEPFKCLLVFDNKYTYQIAKLIYKHKSELKFDKKYSQIDKQESNLHDLYTVARNIPELQKLILKSIQYTCPKCVDACTTKVHGISIEKHVPKKWQEYFYTTKWYKQIFSKINYHTL